ncbi:hypothetical protein B0A50_07478 [Salinomyces thailandicus]|uniref:Pentatricopeptide repeat protein n=1 Tax=Salinomyces thailandicus TaxID=706561 RepID=A0A4U0TN78_9PEZI|nr:hypothetical protein B0A50_07478 [Salinomyces thailandica]
MEAFARKRGTIGRSVWRELALWLLYHERDAVDDFLLSTNSPLYPPINWVEDCLILLARQYSLLDDGTQRSRLQKLAATFLELVPRETNEQWVFNQAFVRHILPVCSESQIDHIYRLIKIDKIKLTPYTLLHVANAFAKRNKLEQALSSLLEAKDCGANVNTVGFRSICATILRRSNQQGGLRVCLRLIENLVSMGVRLNRTLCNIVMLNAVEAGDLDTADAVHRSALEQNFELNAHTCAIRLKACKMDIHNSARLKLAIEEAIANGDIRTNAVIAGELLHCLTLQSFVDREGWEMAFKKVATACVELFDTGPMERLGLDMPEVPPNTSSTPRLTPSRHVFMYLLITYLRRGTTVEQATQLYNRWRELVEAGDKSLADCATTAHVSNVFLRRFVRSRDSLLQAAKVVKDMQKPLPRSARANQAPPDVYTWSIFLHGFASNGHTRLAEQVLRYMRSKGMEPNEVTWTSLVGGYAREQDSNGLLESMKRMQDSGIALSEWTRRGLGRFKDRGRLRGILEQQRLQQSLDFSGDLKSGLAQRLSTPPLVGQEPLAVTQGSEVQDHTVDGHHQGIFGDSPAEMAEMTTTREVENHTNPDR